MIDERIAEHAAEVMAWLHSEEARGWTYNDLELRIRLSIRAALADTRLSDKSRCIAELEQANRDLERLRVDASKEREEAIARANTLTERVTVEKRLADGYVAELDKADRQLKAQMQRTEQAERERDEAQEHRRILREWIEKDKTGLYAALTKVVKAIEARGWITDGRGPYEWDDERYRQEAGWAFDEVRKIVVDAQKESDKRMRSALAEAPEP